MSDVQIVRAKVWKRVTASILDFFTAFAVVGYAVAALTGNMKDGGFTLNGWPAVVWFALIVAYFFIGRRYAGGTLWDRVFGIRRPQPPD